MITQTHGHPVSHFSLGPPRPTSSCAAAKVESLLVLVAEPIYQRETEKSTDVQIRIRLGSSDYTTRLSTAFNISNMEAMMVRANHCANSASIQDYLEAARLHGRWVEGSG